MATGAKTRTILTRLDCTHCQSPMVISRKKSHQHAKGHIKHMYCYRCRQIQPFIEKGLI